MDPVLSAPLLDGNGAIQEVSQVRHNTEHKKLGSSFLRQLSGKWQFKFEKFIREGAFHDAEDLGEGRREYNRKQRQILAIFDESSAPVTSRNEEGRETIAVNISNIANVFILLFKVYATLRSHSLAVAASTLDSLLDLLAGAILWFTQFSMKRTNIYKYPIGKLRVQPVGIIVFSAVMATLGLQILITSVEQLFEGNPHNQLTSQQIIWLVAILGTAFILKLGLFLYCRSFENEIVQAYSMDHYFDVITNIAGLAAALLANRFYWWIDPVGAIGLAVYTIVNWSKAVFENAVSLIGKSAPPEVLQKLTYMAFIHDPNIKRIDTVRAYTFGALYFVEVDIELPEDMPLRVAHDIGESLQIKFEALPEVERAFVHLDFESTHKPEHESRVVFDD